MGINLTEAKDADTTIFDVSIDLEHNDGVDMSDKGNPTVMSVQDFQIFSLFRRRRLSVREEDGNPLIYALKGKSPYRIDEPNTLLMWDVAQGILDRWSCPWQPTAVMCVPSSHSVSQDLGGKVATHLKVACLSSSMIEKKTIKDVMSEAEALKDGGGVGKEDLKAFKKQLGRFKSVPDGKLFQMKDIKAVEVRHYFAPWKAAGSLDVAAGHQILLVDDLIGSGASLLSCAQFIKEQGHTVVGGLSLFSPLDRELAQTVRA